MPITTAQAAEIDRGDLNTLGEMFKELGFGSLFKDLQSAPTVGAGSITDVELASDAVTTAKILDANVTAAKIANEAGIYHAYKALTNAQLKALHATPIEVIAQPGSGLYIEPVSIHAVMKYATAAFDSVGATDYLELRYTDGSGALLVDTVSPVGFGDASADAFINIRPATSYAPSRSSVVAYIAGGEWYAAAGGGALKIVVKYRLRTLDPSA